MKNKKITTKTMLNEVIQINPNAAEHLFEVGMFCIGCPAATQETLEDGCRAHGLSKKQIDELVEKLNQEKK